MTTAISLCPSEVRGVRGEKPFGAWFPEIRFGFGGKKEKSFEGLVGMEGWRAQCTDLNTCVSNGKNEGVVWEETKEIIFHQGGREGESGMNSSHVSSVITRNFSGPGM